jgi:hypothetical protein
LAERPWQRDASGVRVRVVDRSWKWIPAIRVELQRLIDPADAGRSNVAAALDVEEHAALGRGPDEGWTFCEPRNQRLLHELGYSLQAATKTVCAR